MSKSSYEVFCQLGISFFSIKQSDVFSKIVSSKFIKLESDVFSLSQDFNN